MFGISESRNDTELVAVEVVRVQSLYRGTQTLEVEYESNRLPSNVPSKGTHTHHSCIFRTRVLRPPIAGNRLVPLEFLVRCTYHYLVVEVLFWGLFASVESTIELIIKSMG